MGLDLFDGSRSTQDRPTVLDWVWFADHSHFVIVKQILAKAIQLADQFIKTTDEAGSFKSKCSKLKSKIEKLVTLLRQAARASNDLYERPTRLIIDDTDDTDQVLEKALALVHKCRAHGLVKRVFTIIPAALKKERARMLLDLLRDSHLENRLTSSVLERIVYDIATRVDGLDKAAETAKRLLQDMVHRMLSVKFLWIWALFFGLLLNFL
ncbi:uncharacterized protein LOC114275448 [Camellia sinensis]|uniref:uncharacterized protein LOC114275448 n=1 Tax=Camellia sinensis TaxID=4442 RepID=UPI001036507F|nr:uncharacterized protein LOC114275448 [Camellia sinensis]